MKKHTGLSLLFLFGILAGLHCIAATPLALGAANGLGEKPYLGWSSWSLCACTIPGYGKTWLNEAHVKEQSDAMAAKLQKFGYVYINIDGGWTNGFDEYGRPIPDPARFPNGLKSVGDYIHAKGQKMGVHLKSGMYPAVYEANYPILGTSYHMKDIVYQPLTKNNGWKGAYAINWKHPGAQAYIDSIAAQLAGWGVDLLKLDGITPDIPQSPKASDTDNRGDVAAWSAALIKTGRPIWFTLSWYVNPAYGDYWRKYANGMRANGDVEWAGHNQLVSWTEPYFGLRARWLDTTQTRPTHNIGPDTTMEQWMPYVGDGTWADMDSLDVGNGAMDGLSEDERQSYMTMWAICSSPLYSGDDLTKLDDAGMKMLTNTEVLAVNQAGLRAKAKDAGTKKPVWWSKNKDGSMNVALFNLNDSATTMTVKFDDLGGNFGTVRDLWNHKDLGTIYNEFRASIPKHGARLLRVSLGIMDFMYK